MKAAATTANSPAEHRARPRFGLRHLLACAALAGATGAFAQVSLSIDIGTPPPPPRVEAVPAVPPGQIWVPGYWEWVHGTHVWRRGHLMAARPGYSYVPARWEGSGKQYHFEPGHWERGGPAPAPRRR